MDLFLEAGVPGRVGARWARPCTWWSKRSGTEILCPFTGASESEGDWRRRGSRTCPAGWTHRLERCYQVMETEDRALLDQWITSWSDIVDFEVHPVISSKEAAERIAPRL